MDRNLLLMDRPVALAALMAIGQAPGWSTRPRLRQKTLERHV
jgi:hypothetical protein